MRVTKTTRQSDTYAPPDSLILEAETLSANSTDDSEFDDTKNFNTSADDVNKQGRTSLLAKPTKTGGLDSASSVSGEVEGLWARVRKGTDVGQGSPTGQTRKPARERFKLSKDDDLMDSEGSGGEGCFDVQKESRKKSVVRK